MSPDETRDPTGYAPLGYPVQPQYPPPPPGSANYPYNQGAVPPQGTAYYASAQLPSTLPESSKGYMYARIALILLILFMIGSLALGIFTWMVFRQCIPLFKIQAFSVPYFNVTGDSTLEARWEANITSQNPTHKMELHLVEIAGALVYRGMTLDLAVIDPLHLGPNIEGLMRANFSVPEKPGEMDKLEIPAGLVREMAEDRKSGSAEFDLRMSMEAIISSAGTPWIKRSVTRVLCGDIMVNFPSPTGGGTWNGQRGECLTYE